MLLLMPYLTSTAKKFAREVKEMLNMESSQLHLIPGLCAPWVSESLEWDDGWDHLRKDIILIHIYTISLSQFSE